MDDVNSKHSGVYGGGQRNIKILLPPEPPQEAEIVPDRMFQFIS